MPDEPSPPAESRPRPAATSARAADWISRYGSLLAWATVIAVFWALRPSTFGSRSNFENIFGSQAVLLVLTLGLLLALTVSEFDLSIAGSMSIAIVVLGVLNGELKLSVWVAVLAALACGLAIGTVNGLITVVVGVPSIVVTLGTGTLLLGVAVAIRQTVVTDISPGFITVISHRILGLPLAFYYGLILTILIWYVLSYTPLGRYMFFVGANRNVARLTGLPVERIRIGALAATGLVSALAGVILVGTLGSAGPQFAPSYLLPAFAAAFLGSTTIRPGRFNAWGSFVAVYFLITGITGLELVGLSGWIEDVFYGGSLVVAASLSHLTQARSRRLFRQ
jgi:ribose transport system permease protein